jgi:hypothetical protein
MPDGTLKEQERDNARDGILAALGLPLPVPAAPASAAEAAEESGGPEVPGAQ